MLVMDEVVAGCRGHHYQAWADGENLVAPDFDEVGQIYVIGVEGLDDEEAVLSRELHEGYTPLRCKRHAGRILVIRNRVEKLGSKSCGENAGERRDIEPVVVDGDCNDLRLEAAGKFGSMVLGRRSACARLWQGETAYYLNDLVVVGEQLTFLNLDGRSETTIPSPSDIFDRSLALTGPGALARLARSRIGIVGLSGTGSLMAELLMRTGAGELVLFEFDPADRTNLGRVLHLRSSDLDPA